MIRLTAQLVTLDAAEGDAPSRTITGLAVRGTPSPPCPVVSRSSS